MPRKAGGKNYAPLVRGMVSVAIAENKEKIRQAITDALIEDPIQALKDLQWLTPKELLVEQNVSGSISVDTNTLSTDILREAFTHRREPDTHRREPEAGIPDASTEVH